VRTVYDVAALRARIPALSAGTAFFDGPGGTQTPIEVAGAIAATLAAPLSNRGTVTPAARNAEAIVVAAREAVADLLGADPAGVVFGRSMTQLAYDLSRALARDWGPGDEVLVTRLDHGAHIRPWIHAAEARGASARWIEFDGGPDGSGELTLEHVAARLTERTRLVAVTGASNLIGTRPPLAEIAALVHSAGGLLSVDGVHLTAHAGVDVGPDPAHPDLFFCSPYKFLGPHCGVLAADPGLLAQLHPDKLAASSDAVPERFELGTLPYELLAGTTAAVDVLASLGDGTGDRRTRVLSGMAAVERHEDRLRTELEHGLGELPGVMLRSRAGHRTPTLLLTFDGRDAAAVADHLAARQINAPAGSFYALEASRHLGLGDAGGLRIGLAPYTDADEITRLLAALRELPVV